MKKKIPLTLKSKQQKAESSKEISEKPTLWLKTLGVEKKNKKTPSVFIIVWKV